MEKTSRGKVSYVHPEEAGFPFPEDIRTALDRIGREVNAGASIDEALDCVWEATKDLVPRDRVGLAFLDSDGARVVSHYCRAEYEDLRLGAGYSAPLAGSSLKPIMDTGKARIIGSLEEYLEGHPESNSTKILLKEGVRSSLTLPLRVGQRRVGFLFFSSRDTGVFTAGHARTLLAVLDRVSQAVEKAWIIKRLSDANRNYQETLGFVAHEIKSPLASVTAKGMTYLEGFLGKVDPIAAKTIQEILKTSAYLMDMVNNYLDLSRLETGEMRFEPAEGVRFVEDAVRFAADTTSAHAGRREAEIAVSAPKGEVVLKGDGPLLRIVMVNLLDNAIKYGIDKQTVQVKISVKGGWAEVRVRNRGVGFTSEQARKLFRRFSRLRQKGTEDRKGSGLGLYLAWWIVQQHEGSLTAESEPGKWAEFTLRLPNARLEK